MLLCFVYSSRVRQESSETLAERKLKRPLICPVISAQQNPRGGRGEGWLKLGGERTRSKRIKAIQPFVSSQHSTLIKPL